VQIGLLGFAREIIGCDPTPDQEIILRALQKHEAEKDYNSIFVMV